MGNRFETQDRLIAATRHIVINEGAETTSVEHICKVAGFTRGAFYSNFASKDSLLAALAEDEYAALIERLRATVDEWAAHPRVAAEGDEGDSELLIENLLYEALDAIGVDKSLYILHSELLMRSIRDPEWGARLLDINVEFIDELGRTLEWILNAAGRELAFPLRAMTHSVIGIVMRAAGLAAWREAVLDRAASSSVQQTDARIWRDAARKSARSVRSNSAPTEPGSLQTTTVEQDGPEEGAASSVRDSAAREVLEVVLQVLYSSSTSRR